MEPQPIAKRATRVSTHPTKIIKAQEGNQGDGRSTRVALASAVFIFLLSLSALIVVYKTFPKVTMEERQHIKLPRNMEEAKRLGTILNRYKGDHYFQVMTGVCATFLFLQFFGLPGTFCFSVLAGFLFPLGVALMLACTCSALGTSLSFLLSKALGRGLILKYFPERTQAWADQVNKHRDNLYNYLLFLRITPFVPCWFINITAPVVGVPLVPFALCTFFGVAPPNFVAVQGGQTLRYLAVEEAAVSTTSFIWLGVCGVVPLLPIVFKGYLKKRIV